MEVSWYAFEAVDDVAFGQGGESDGVAGELVDDVAWVAECFAEWVVWTVVGCGSAGELSHTLFDAFEYGSGAFRLICRGCWCVVRHVCHSFNPTRHEAIRIMT